MGLVPHDEFSNVVCVLKSVAYAAGSGYVAACIQALYDAPILPEEAVILINGETAHRGMHGNRAAGGVEGALFDCEALLKELAPKCGVLEFRPK